MILKYQSLLFVAFGFLGSDFFSEFVSESSEDHDDGNPLHPVYWVMIDHDRKQDSQDFASGWD